MLSRKNLVLRIATTFSVLATSFLGLMPEAKAATACVLGTHYTRVSADSSANMILKFTNTAVCTFTIPASITSITALVVGGGGGGGPDGGSGGGGGELREGTVSVTAGATMDITIGAGGSGGVWGGSSGAGGNSTITGATTFTAVGGGAGAGWTSSTGASGGTGGTGGTGTNGQQGGGGPGGSCNPIGYGTNAPGTTPSSSVPGSTTYFGGGGGGGFGAQTNNGGTGFLGALGGTNSGGRGANYKISASDDVTAINGASPGHPGVANTGGGGGGGSACNAYGNMATGIDGVYQRTAGGSGANGVVYLQFSGTPNLCTGVTVTSNQNQQATVSWTAPTYVGSGITGYKIQQVVSGGNWTNEQSTGSTSTSFVVTGLTNGTEYFFRVAAVTAAGTGPYPSLGPFSSGIPATAPGAPTSLVATPGNGQISISFTAGATNGTAITNYQYSTDGTTYTAFATPITTSPVTVTGLTNGQSYTIRLKAVNAAGVSTAATASAVTPFTNAAPPTSLVATAGNNQVSISFTAGANNGSAITNYKYSIDGGSTYSAFATPVTTSPVTITGLTGGTTYSIYLKAVNSAGDSVASASVSATPYTNPSAPSGLIATASNTQISISFTPGATNGSAITNYKYSIDGGSTYTAFATPVTTSPVVITGLTNGTSYTIFLKSVNIAGDSSASSSVTATPFGVAAAPTGLVATPGDGQISVSFTPGSANGSPITDYQYSLDNGVTYTTFASPVTSSPILITGLTNGTAYVIKLKAVNSAGLSSASASVTSTPRTTPGAPTSITATSNANAQSSISWTSPSSTGGSGIIQYSVRASTDGGSTWANAVLTGSAVASYTYTGLTNGTSYTFQVAAVNAAGTGTYSLSSSAIIPSTTPSAPTSLSATTTSTTAVISFTPGSDGGSAITNYQYSKDGGATFTAFSPTQTSSPVTITGLSTATNYTILLKAVNARGAGTASSSVSVATEFPIPTFATLTNTGNGYKILIDNYSSTYTYSVTTTAGIVSIGITTTTGKLPILVSGLNAGASATITVTAAKSGFTSVSNTYTASANAATSTVACSPTSSLSGGYITLEFTTTTSDKNCVWTVPTGVTTATSIAVVGGGGSGGNQGNAGGGGAGSLLTTSDFPLTPGSTINLTIGAGGGAPASYYHGNSGNNTLFGDVVAIGGGGAAGGNATSPTSWFCNGIGGGSGGGGDNEGCTSTGGASFATTLCNCSNIWTVYGNAGGGGRTYGGGGGAGSAGVGSTGGNGVALFGKNLAVGGAGQYGGTGAGVANTGSGGAAYTAGSAGIIIIQYLNLVAINSVAPVISGSPVVGQVLTVSDGTWSPVASSYKYQWSRSTTAAGTYSDIAGATNSTYTVLDSDVGYYFKASVIAVTIGGDSLAALTTATAIARPAAPTGLSLAAASDTGESNSDQITRLTQLTITGNAAPGITVNLKNGGTATGTSCVANASGVFSCTTSTGLVSGSRSFTAYATSSGGTTSADSSALNVTIDVTAPVKSSATVSSSGATLTIAYGETLSATTASTSQFAVTGASSRSIPISSIAISGTNLVLTFSKRILSGETVSYTYTDPTVVDDANAVQDAAGNDAVSLFLTTVSATITNSSTITAPSITAPSSGLSTVAMSDYSLTFSSASGGGGSYTYAITAGTLPAGLSLSNRTISGTPTTPGTYSGLQITVTDANGVTATTASFTITVTASSQLPLSLATVNGTLGQPLTLLSRGGSGLGAVTFTVTNGTATTCSLSGSVLTATTSGGVKGICNVTVNKAASGAYNLATSTATAVIFTPYVPVITQATSCPAGTTPSFATGIGVAGCQPLAPVAPQAGDAGAAPKITSLSVATGLVGTSVTITGTGFSSATKVQFGAKSTTIFTATSTTITVAVPTGATTGRVMVFSPTGTAMASQIFTVVVPDVTAPSFLIAAVNTSTPTQITLTYNESLASSNISASAFVVQVAGSNRSVSSVAISGTTVTLTLSSAVTTGQVVAFTYTSPGDSTAIQDAAGNVAASLTSTSVTGI